LNIVEKSAIALRSLDSIAEVLPGKHRGVAHQTPHFTTGVGVIPRYNTAITAAHDLLLTLCLSLLIRLAESSGDVGVLARNDQTGSVLGGGVPLGGEEDGNSNEESPPSPNDTEVSPKVVMAVRERCQVVIASNEVYSRLGSTYSRTSLVITIGESRTTWYEAVPNTRNDLVMELVGQKSVEAVCQGIDPEKPDKPIMHQRLANEIARVHDCGADEKTGNLGSSIKGAESRADSSEKGRNALMMCVSTAELVTGSSALTIVMETRRIQKVKKWPAEAVRPTMKYSTTEKVLTCKRITGISAAI
jgi:hypothetical protein